MKIFDEMLLTIEQSCRRSELFENDDLEYSEELDMLETFEEKLFKNDDKEDYDN